jgi:hypothetical protein
MTIDDVKSERDALGSTEIRQIEAIDQGIQFRGHIMAAGVPTGWRWGHLFHLTGDAGGQR